MRRSILECYYQSLVKVQHKSCGQACEYKLYMSNRFNMQALKNGRLSPQFLQPHAQSKRPGLSLLVLDEADLILSMPGYEQDLKELAPKVAFPSHLLTYDAEWCPCKCRQEYVINNP